MDKSSIIQEIYTRISEEKENSPECDRLLGIYNETNKLFLKQIGEQHQKQLEALTDILDDISEQENLEFFTAGFTIAIKLLSEVYYKRTE